MPSSEESAVRESLPVTLEEAVSHYLVELLRFQPGERLLVYVDGDSDPRVSRALLEGARDRGGSGELMELDEARGVEEMQAALEARVEERPYHVICELSGDYFYPSRAWRKALRRGARIHSPGDLNVESFIASLAEVDHAAMQRFGGELKRLLATARDVRISAAGGSDIRCRMNPGRLERLLLKLTGRRRSCVWDPSGQPLEAGQATFLEGQLAFQGQPESIEGVAVIDGYLWPPRDIGVLKEGIVIHIERGVVTRIEGCAVKAPRLRRWIKGRPQNVEHVCIGYNPGARPERNLCEAERALGALSIGFGEWPFHSDGVFRAPNLELDGVPVLREGKFVHPALRELAGSLAKRPARGGA